MASRPVALPTIAVIGGSGLYELPLQPTPQILAIITPFAPEPVVLSQYLTTVGRILFLPRHGADHTIAPHLINYRANVWALQSAGAKVVLAINAVGGIAPELAPGSLLLPDQLIDYSWGREHTFCSGPHALDRHADFTWPYDRPLATLVQSVAGKTGLVVHQGGTYACTQGPRLESAAEIRRLARDGCDIVGMTGMPEAGLARELGLRYVCLALVVNRAAGLGAGIITQGDIEAALVTGMDKVRRLLHAAVPELLAAAADSP